LFLCAVTSIAFAPRLANASNVKFVGVAAYSYVGNVAVLTANQVANFDPFGFSGTLHLELWAFSTPYSGSLTFGYKMAQYSLGQLTAGFVFNNIDSGPILFVPPPDGVWYFTLVLTEFTGGPTDGGYDVRDFVNFPNTVIFGPPPPPGQLQGPGTIVFPPQQVGTESGPTTITITNVGGLPVTISSVVGSDLTEFPGTTTCLTIIAPGANCQIVVSFLPTAAGPHAETIVITSDGLGSPQGISLSGTGISAPPPPPGGNIAVAVEYYYAAWNFYFVTAIPAEVAALDGGAFGGVWKRTGQQFNVYSTTGARDLAAGATPVWRFFSTTFAPKSSHFYTDIVAEYNSLLANPNWQLEGPVFSTPPPAADGSCPAGSIPIYRLFNNGMGGAPNHRFTTDPNVRAQMIALGWTPEGFGIGVVFCSPQ
jgi:hypothetical protein